MKPTPRTPTPQRATKQTAGFTADLQEQIRGRAYELYEQRGREGGRDLDDWLHAESEVTKKRPKTATA